MAVDQAEEKFFGMTRKEAIDLADALCKETDVNHPAKGSGTYPEYIETLKRGQEALKRQAGYYPHLQKET